MSNLEKVIEKAIKELNKTYEDHSAGVLSEREPKGFIPTGNLAIDWCIGRPGIPIGRVTEVSGKYGAGKSSIVAGMIGAAQASGAYCILNDIENSYSSDWSRRFKVVPETLILLDPPHLEGLFDRTREVIEIIRKEDKDTPILVATDSVSAAPTASELEEEDSAASKTRAEHARVISRELRKISKLLWEKNVALVFVSQLKSSAGGGGWGEDKHKLGGSAIPFHSGLMLELVRTNYKVDDTTKAKVGQTVQVQAVKNKFTLPFRPRVFDLYYEEGIRPKEILIDFLVDDLDLVKKSGGWYEWEGSKYHKADLAQKLPDELLVEIYDKLGIK